MKIAIVGSNGRFGSFCAESLRNNNAEIIEIDKKLEVKSLEDLKELPDKVLDVSNYKNSLKVLKFCQKHKIPLLLACTGHTKQQISKMQKLTTAASVIYAPNLSFGVFSLLKIIPTFANSEFTATIHEVHHKNKLDRPSGTAILLANALKKANIEVCDISSLRQDNTLKTHTINLVDEDESITITHTATSLKPFLYGVVKYLNLVGELEPGFYMLPEVINNV